MSRRTHSTSAAVIARFAETTRPVPEGYDERQEQFRELIVRRRQLLDHRMAEKNRREMAHSPLVRKSVLKLIETLNKDLKRIEKAILQLVESNDDWRARFERLKPHYLGREGCVRNVLSMAALSAKKHNPVIRTFAARLLALPSPEA